jgi:hypothetical protein
MEDSVSKTVGLLDMLSITFCELKDRMGSKHTFGGFAGTGIRKLAGDCAESLRQNWTDAHEQTLALIRTGTGTCPAVIELHTSILASSKLLHEMIERLAEEEIREREGKTPESDSPSGYIVMDEVGRSLAEKYNTAFDEYCALSDAIRQRAAA